MKTFKILSSALLSQISSTALLMAVSIITARNLGPEGRGIYAFFFTLSGLLFGLFSLGVSQANIYFLNKKSVNLEIILGNSLVVSVLQFILITIILFVFHNGLFGELIVKSNKLELIILLGISSLLQIYDASLSGIFLAKLNYSIYSLNAFLQGLLIFLGTLPIFLSNIKIEHVILLRLIMMSIVFSWLIMKCKRLYELSFEFSVPTLKKQIKFGAKSNIQNLIGLLNYKLYILFVGYKFGAREVGLLSVALLFVEGIRYLPNLFGTFLLPKLSAVTEEKSAKYTLQILQITLLGSGLILIVTIFFMQTIIYLIFGDKFICISGLIKHMLVGGFFGIFYQILSRFFTSKNLHQRTIMCGVLGLIISLIILFASYKNIGLMSVAKSFMISNLLVGMLMFNIFCIEAKISRWKILNLHLFLPLLKNIFYFRHMTLQEYQREEHINKD